MLHVGIPYSLLTHEETACEKLKLRTYAHFYQVVRILSSIMDSTNMYIYIHISESVIHIYINYKAIILTADVQTFYHLFYIRRC